MRLIQNLFLSLALCGLAGSAAASPDAPVNGAEYLTLPQAQETEAGAKVEVTEFFTYSCPHCNAFDPVLAGWVKKNAAKVLFKRVHVNVNGGPDAVLQRLHISLDLMGIGEKMHAKIFSAIHEQRVRITSDEAAFDWAEKAGIERAKLIAVYRSFGIQARVTRAQALTEAYQVRSWPMVAVGGRYTTSPHQAGHGATPHGTAPHPTESFQHQAALKVMDHLVLKAKSDKK